MNPRMKTMLAIAVLTFATHSASAVTMFSDGGIHLINTNLMDSISVSNATTAEVTTGGVAKFVGLSMEVGAVVTGGSDLILSGGTIEGNFGAHGATVTDSNFVGTSGLIQGGSLPGGGTALRLTNSTFNISGGTYQGGDGMFVGGPAIVIDGGSTGFITGGNFFPGGGSFMGFSAPTLNIDGGDVQISGGLFANNRNFLVGGSSASVINFIGSNFQLTGSTLTGTLADNSDLNINLLVGDFGTVLFNGEPLTQATVPEPSTLALAMLAATLLARRRKTPPA